MENINIHYIKGIYDRLKSLISSSKSMKKDILVRDKKEIQKIVSKLNNEDSIVLYCIVYLYNKEHEDSSTLYDEIQDKKNVRWDIDNFPIVLKRIVKEYISQIKDRYVSS